MLQGDNGSKAAYLIAGISALAAVVALLWRHIQSQQTTTQNFYANQLESTAQQLEATSRHLDAERQARRDEFRAFVAQLDLLARQTREAHQDEMKQVLTRLAESDKIAARQTEILAQLRRERNK